MAAPFSDCGGATEMYATLIWKIDQNSTNSQQIKAGLQQIIGAHASTLLWANVALVSVPGVIPLNDFGDALEELHTRFPTEFDYVCVGSAAGSQLAPFGRPGWDMKKVQEIIS